MADLPTFRLITGDCIEHMAQMPEASVDAIVTDPPYGLEFMGKEWDRFDNGWRRRKKEQSDDPEKDWGAHNRLSEHGPHLYVGGHAAQTWHQAWATQALRVLKPGGHLLAFGGTRTYHRLACAIEDAGFEIRDCLAWMYGSGFPKSLDVSKAIDKAAGAEREVVGVSSTFRPNTRPNGTEGMRDRTLTGDLTAPATPEAQTWQGWGTALKPAYEPIVLARKPLVGTVAGNVLEHGTGALNVDGCRIGTSKEVPASPGASSGAFPSDGGWTGMRDGASGLDPNIGRWPANVLLDEQAAAMLDEQTGERSSGWASNHVPQTANPTVSNFGAGDVTGPHYGDTGGASRFFYTSKASSAERNRGVEYLPEQAHGVYANGKGMQGRTQVDGEWQNTENDRLPRPNTHPTVKPVDLMQWLCRLITPPGGTVLDPFTGSGSTGMAALREGFTFIGIEREPEYVEIARARIVGDGPLFNVEAE